MHRSALRLFVALLLALAALPLSALAAHAATYTITGKITTQSGAAVTSGVEIEVWGLGGPYTAVPNSTGTYTISGIPSDSWLEVRLQETDAQGTYMSDARYFSAGITSNTTVDFVLKPFTGIVVTTTDSAGAPLRGIVVGSHTRTAGDEYGWYHNAQSHTTASGRAAIELPATASYAACAEDSDYNEYNEYQPTYRYESACYGGATWETATELDLRTQARRAVTITMPLAGRAMLGEHPFIYGTLAVGSPLKVDTGVWTPSDVSLSYHWFRNTDTGDNVPVGTGASYTPTSADNGSRICVTVTGTKNGYASHAPEDCRTGVVGWASRTMNKSGVIQGTGRVGTWLWADIGGATYTPSPALEDIEWRANGEFLTNDRELEITPALAGKRITLRVMTDSTTDQQLNEVRELLVGPVALYDFTTAPVPTISGTVAVGNTLTAKPGTWAPAPDSFAYQWYRSGTAISGATAATYTLTSTDLGKTMTVKVTASKTNYVTTARTSAATAAVLNSFTTAPTPTISGTAAVGYTLTGSRVAPWSPTPDSYTYRWLRDGAIISGATTATYKLTSADIGHKIQFRVSGAKAGYLTTYRVSAATAPVANVFSTAPTPTVTGTTKVGYTLTGNRGTWSPTPDSFGYQWYRVNSAGTATAITGATATTYKLTTADRGYTIRFRVIARKTGYLTTSRYSAKTATIA